MKYKICKGTNIYRFRGSKTEWFVAERDAIYTEEDTQLIGDRSTVSPFYRFTLPASAAPYTHIQVPIGRILLID